MNNLITIIHSVSKPVEGAGIFPPSIKQFSRSGRQDNPRSSTHGMLFVPLPLPGLMAAGAAPSTPGASPAPTNMKVREGAV